MFNLRRLQSCLENNVCDFFPYRRCFLLFFLSPVFFFHLCYAKCKSWDNALMTYGRDRWQAHSYMPRHTVPLFINEKSLTESLCLYLHFLNPSIWRAREIKHPSKPVLSLAFCCLALSWTTPCDSGEKVFHRHRASLRSNAAVISHAEYSSIAVLLWCLDKSIWFASA